mmetsp:Transcript_44998/g.75666  ORF Transcript_44998/g.75666 Transcript_44998/m.75666 type:complete len:309 (+) Transcript_44998:3302-4228(+)
MLALTCCPTPSPAAWTAGNLPTPATMVTTPEPGTASGKRMASSQGTGTRLAAIAKDVAMNTGSCSPRLDSLCSKASLSPPCTAIYCTVAAPSAILCSSNTISCGACALSVTDFCVGPTNRRALGPSKRACSVTGPSRTAVTVQPARKVSPTRTTRGMLAKRLTGRRATTFASAFPKRRVTPSFSATTATARTTHVPMLSGTLKDTRTRPWASAAAFPTNIAVALKSDRSSTAGAADAAAAPPMAVPYASASAATGAAIVFAVARSKPLLSIAARGGAAPGAAASIAISSTPSAMNMGSPRGTGRHGSE